MDLPLAFTEEQTARPLSQKLETAVKRLGKSLDHAVFLINGQFMEHSQFIHPQKSEDNKKNNKNESGKKKGGKKAQHHKAEETTTTEGTCTSDDDGYRCVEYIYLPIFIYLLIYFLLLLEIHFSVIF